MKVVTSAAELLRLRRRIWNRINAAVRELVGETPAELKRYERRYRNALLGACTPVTSRSVEERVVSADLVFCGDYHSFRPAQATCRSLLAAMAARSPRVALLVELALSDHQVHLDRFANGEIGEPELLRRLDYRRTWGFGWSGYRPLFEFARQNAIPVIGINGPGTAARASLAERDAWAAGVIARTAREMPDTQLLVLAGDLHLASEHLPRATARALAAHGLSRRMLRVFQNSDDVYWRLQRQGVEAEAVRLDDDADAYCVFNGTPWAKLESYLSWLEGAGDEASAELGLSGEGFLDTTDRILELSEVLARFLGLPAEGLDGFSIYTADDLSFVQEMRRRKHTAVLLPHALASDVFLIPQANLLYLARLDLGHAAEAAAEVLLQLTSPAGAGEKLGGEGAFFRRAYRRALTWFGSKILNPLRRPTGGEREARAATLISGYVSILRDAIEGNPGRVIPGAIFEDDVRLHLAVSTDLGRAAGERLYQRFVAQALAPDEAARLFGEVPEESEARAALGRIYRGAPVALAESVVA